MIDLEMVCGAEHLARVYVGATAVAREPAGRGHDEVLALVLPDCTVAMVVWAPEDGRLFEFLGEMLAATVPGRQHPSVQP